MGRKSTFDRAVADRICEQLGQGIPLAEICRGEGMPAVRTVSDWKEAHKDFAAAFARAREEGFDAIASQCLEIADDARNDFVEKKAAEGDEAAIGAMAFDSEHVQRSKLRIETRLKLLAKWDPKRYGEKMVVAGDPDAPLGGPPVTGEVLAALANMTPEQLRAMATKPLKDE